jgi:hypothetical protein
MSDRTKDNERLIFWEITSGVDGIIPDLQKKWENRRNAVEVILIDSLGEWLRVGVGVLVVVGEPLRDGIGLIEGVGVELLVSLREIVRDGIGVIVAVARGERVRDCIGVIVALGVGVLETHVGAATRAPFVVIQFDVA